MKKFIISFFSILLIALASIGGGLLLSACDNSSYSENVGEGIGDSTNEDVNTPSDGPNDENENSGSEESNSNLDDGVSALAVSFTVQQRTTYSDGDVENSGDKSSWHSGHWFNLTWHEGDGKWGNGDPKTWGGNGLTMKRAGPNDIQGGGKKDNYANNLGYANYYYGTGVQRYAKIIINDSDTTYALWDFSSSTSAPTNQDTTSTYYFYGSGKVSKSEPSGTGTSMSGTWYVHYRQRMTLKYDLQDGTGSFSDKTFYAGLSTTLTSTKPTRTGYTFAGWKVNGGLYEAGATVSWNDLKNNSSSRTAYALWQRNSYRLTYESNGGTEFEDDYVLFNDYYGKAQLYNIYDSDLDSGITIDYNYGGAYIINKTNSTSSTQWLNFFQIYFNYFDDSNFSPSTKYTCVVETLSFSGNSFYFALTSPNDAGANQDVATAQTGCTISKTGIQTFTFTTRSSIGTPEYFLRSYFSFNANTKCSAVIRISIFVGNVYYDNYLYAYNNNLPDNNRLPIPTRTGYIFEGWYSDSALTNKVTASTKVTTIGNKTLYAKWEKNVHKITLDKQSGSAGTDAIYLWYQIGWYSNSAATTSISSITRPTRTGYTFQGYYTETNGSGTQIINSSGSIIGSNTYINADDTLYAYWTINTYTLTINYSSTVGVTNATNINISASGCTISNNSIPSGQSSKISHTYTTSSYSIVLKLSNSSSYDYYMRIGSKPTTSSYTLIYDDANDSHTYTWTPDSNDSITIYIYQRYTISYNGNNKTSGTVPSTQYKIFGTNLTLSANNLSRTGYTSNGWNTKSGGTGSHYASSGSYSVNANATLYAEWKANVYTITLNKQSGSGGTSTIYLKYNTGWYSNSAATSSIVKVSVPTRAGFTFQGYYTGTNGSGTQVINSSGQIISGRTTITTSNISLHAYWTAKNPARYDSEKGYWYVEMGYYPQTRATQTEINGITNTNGAVYTINGTDVTSKIGANSIEYCQYNGVWYKVEPVRYVLAGDYSAGNGYENANVLSISEKIVYVSEWSVENNGLDSKYIYTWNTSSDMFENNSTLHNNLINNFWSESGLSVYKDSYNYIGTRTDFYVENFPEIDGTSTSETIPWGVTYLATSTRDLDTVFGSGNYGTEFSDLVSDILGNNLMYWTRDVGSNLNNAECITRFGEVTQARMQKMLGVRITVNVKTFGCE